MKEQNNDKKWYKNKITILVLILLISIIAITGITFAVFNFLEVGTENSLITTGQLKLELSAESTGINETNQIPTTDAEGMLRNPYTFTIENTGTMSSTYSIKLVNDTEAIEAAGATAKLLDHSKLKVQYNDETPVLLSSLTNGVIATGTIDEGASIDNEIRMWIDWDAGNEVMLKEVYLKIVVEGTQN